MLVKLCYILSFANIYFPSFSLICLNYVNLKGSKNSVCAHKTTFKCHKKNAYASVHESPALSFVCLAPRNLNQSTLSWELERGHLQFTIFKNALRECLIFAGESFQKDQVGRFMLQASFSAPGYVKGTAWHIWVNSKMCVSTWACVFGSFRQMSK